MKIELETEGIRKTKRRSDYKGGRRHRPLETQWDRQEFIGWDGEGTQPQIGHEERKSFTKKDERTGRTIQVHVPNPKEKLDSVPQPYVLFGNSKGEQIINEQGLGTKECFELLLNSKQKYPESIFVGFSINYDVNQMLADLPMRCLKQIYKTNSTWWQGYKLQWYPGKWFYIKHKNRRVKLFDIFGFFQSSFLVACEKYLGTDHPLFLRMKEGKTQRSTFTFDQLDYMIKYYHSELQLLVELMTALRTDLHNADIHLSSWHGPGAIAGKVFQQFNIKQAMAECPKEVNDAAQYAYAGGRFEQFYCGRYSDIVYEYDINSAYPSAIRNLPNLSNGYWESVSRFEPGSFGIWYCDYNGKIKSGRQNLPQPLFCRNKNSLITYPYQTRGWYYTPEASHVIDSVQQGFVFREDGEKPFSFVEEMYERRKEYKSQGISTERALKLALNSMYGKMAQRIGFIDDKKPTWHQLEWAGYITSYTRAKIYEAVLQQPDAIIAIETDAVFSTKPLTLPISTNLGDWEESLFDEITYLQSGFYYGIERGSGRIICKYRGLDKDPDSQFPRNLNYDVVLRHLKHAGKHRGRGFPLRSTTTRFNGLGITLNTHAIWRAWETNSRSLAIGGDEKGSKRTHGTRCYKCDEGANMYETLHPCRINGYSGDSHKHILPWIEDETIFQAMDTELLWQ
jgi:DNA polymerase type B, organellar and viral